MVYANSRSELSDVEPDDAPMAEMPVIPDTVAMPLFTQTDIWQLVILGCVRKHNMNRNIN